MRNRQRTIQREFSVSGIGLHTGARVQLCLRPAPAYSGIVFRRVDLDNFEIPASPQHVAHVSYQTALVRSGVLVATVEHLIAALIGTGVTNVIVDIDGFEIPILDGSARPFVDLLKEVGTIELDAPVQYLRILRPVGVSNEDKSIHILPSEKFSIAYLIDFDHPLIGRQQTELVIDEESFIHEIAPARTFTLLKQVESLQRMGLIRGGSLENAVVLSDEGILNEDGLRFPDEFVRHKILDLIGDLGLLGRPILGHIEAVRSGHGMHNALVAKLLREPHTWEIVEAPWSTAVASH